ncbi:MAG TPA: diaminobutyrate--2-oxoglutarate transaminase [Myxococcales bacterium]|nr:diaminobutyrate--2-oxoglutarate transaminase [Deltaproteobacteria bacterium]MBU48667.1 diaminobutyrate--2-oxoglutarate transaminase [Deltaproteobacteria bacterium]HAA57273.1 diaminobutyrate--2-oxoglutarate transaminase [Myxococcales bacterium]|tara:strand:+ start:12679 stop:13938 length:1260 start_codon:yes stop_codon:yes gene_type:complete
MTQSNTFSALESEVRSYSRAFPCTLQKAQGAEIWDIEGRRFLDFLAGAGSLNYGHNNPQLKQALLDYIESDAITHSLDLQTTAKETFLRTMNKLILEPRGLEYVMMFTGPTGTNAIEAAFKLARKATGRTTIVSFTNGFHGVTNGALAATGNQHHRQGAGIPLSGTFVIPYDGYMEGLDSVAYLEKLLSDPSGGLDKPAAIVVETVQGEGGLNAASFEWLKKLQKVANDNDIVFIVDDIQAGCGRTGTFFSFEPAGLNPDMVVLSKSLSGYGLPFALVMIKKDIDVWKPGEHNGTFRGNNHAFVTATAALEHYWKDDTFAQDVRAKGEHLGQRLQALQTRFPEEVVEVRGRGMMRGIRCADPDKAAKISAFCFQHGMIIERSGPHDEVVKCLMPLVTPTDQLDEGLDILEKACVAVFNG